MIQRSSVLSQLVASAQQQQPASSPQINTSTATVSENCITLPLSRAEVQRWSQRALAPPSPPQLAGTSDPACDYVEDLDEHDDSDEEEVEEACKDRLVILRSLKVRTTLKSGSTRCTAAQIDRPSDIAMAQPTTSSCKTIRALHEALNRQWHACATAFQKRSNAGCRAHG